MRKLLTSKIHYITFVLIVFGSVLVSRASVLFLREEAQQRFDLAASAAYVGITDKLEDYSRLLKTVAGLFKASSAVSRVEFNTYVSNFNLQKDYPGVSALFFARPVTSANVEKFINSIRQDKSLNSVGYPNVELVTDDPNKALFYITEFVEPIAGREAALGSDAGQSSERVTAINEAIRLGTNVAAAPVVFASTQQLGIVMYMPVFAPQTNTLQGLAMISFRQAGLTEDLLDADSLNSRLKLRVLDQDKVVVQSPDFDVQQIATDTAWNVDREITFGARSWRIQIYGPPYFGLDSLERVVPLAIVAIGLVFGITLAAVVKVIQRSNARSLSLANKMTAELNKEIAVNKLVLEHTGALIWMLDRAGQISFLNLAAVEAFGKIATLAESTLLQKHTEALQTAIRSAAAGQLTELDLEVQAELLETYRFTFKPIINPDGVVDVIAVTAIKLSDLLQKLTNLQQQVDDLNAINSLMLDREKKIKELKEKLQQYEN